MLHLSFHDFVQMEALLEEKEEELLIKSGQASIFKEKLEDESRAHTDLREKFRSADLKHQSEKEALEEKHRKDLANANMNHQFEVCIIHMLIFHHSDQAYSRSNSDNVYNR